MTETDTANVSRETSPEIGTRPYRSPARRHGLGTTRAALIEAVVAFAAEGNFRPKGADVAQRAGISQPQINHHFGSILGLYAAVARAGTKRAALIEAVVAFAAEGNFRPKGADVARRAGISQPQINHHFGSILGLYAAVARAMPKEISVAIADALDRATKADVDGEQLAWLVLVGCPMEAP